MCWKKSIAGMVIACLCLLIMGTVMVTLPVTAASAQIQKKQFKPRKHITKKERDHYYSNSAFLGNSISKGLKIYFSSSGKGVCGHPVMLVQGCYSFYNDKKQGSPYQIAYRGRRMRAKEAIAASGVKRAFINMGSNDLWKPSAQSYRDYVHYICEIRKRNPRVVIFVQGTTPMCSSRNRKYLNNSAIRDLNHRMKKFCSRQKDIYYVDISKDLKTAEGGLQRKYSSDGYVHMTVKGYRIWTDNLNAYVSKLLLQEKNAKAAVKQAARSKSIEDYQAARKRVDHLDSSTVKQKLQSRLKRIKKKVKKSNQYSTGRKAAPEVSKTPQESMEPEEGKVPQESMEPGEGKVPQESMEPGEGKVPQENTIP